MKFVTHDNLMKYQEKYSISDMEKGILHKTSQS